MKQIIHFLCSITAHNDDADADIGLKLGKLDRSFGNENEISSSTQISRTLKSPHIRHLIQLLNLMYCMVQNKLLVSYEITRICEQLPKEILKISLF